MSRDDKVIAESTSAGTSLGAILTGVVVAGGAMMIFGALIGGIFISLGLRPNDFGVVEGGIAGAVALILAQFLAYMWGGYTAGRMGRVRGIVNGALVPAAAIVITLLIGAAVALAGATARLDAPFGWTRLPIEEFDYVRTGALVGGLSLLAMFGGGVLGGWRGELWHRKVEEQAAESGAAHGVIDLTHEKHEANR